MTISKFDRLLKRGILSAPGLTEALGEAKASGRHPESVLLDKGIPRHELLFSLSSHYGCPFVEYDEDIMVSQNILRGLDKEKLKKSLWIPLSVQEDRAEVIAYDPGDESTVEEIKETLGAGEISFVVALPADIVRIIENNQDLNPGFPSSAGRTPLAKVRTFLADRRSLMACTRTALSKGRTGLAFIRTGISFMAIALFFFRIFGPGYLTIPEVLLFIAGVIITVDGIIWYLPARRSGKKKFTCTLTEATWGTTVLEVRNPGNNPVFVRTAPVKGADRLREEWKNLSPVMRRRFLASDRTDFAEERTVLACYRTAMARARTGLAFTRTGIAFAGLGIAFLRQFHAGAWSIFDASLIITGAVMAAEGFHWYVPGRMAGKEGFAWIRKAVDMASIWDFVFPPTRRRPAPEEDSASFFLKKACSPGIWATTGLALERTVLADRRNVMARLRTIMARSRTGMSLVRTGMSIFAVGTGLLMYFGSGNIPWTVFDIVLMVSGFLLIADGLLWHLPAEKIRRQFPYCFGDMEITVPDYGKPNCTWGKVVFTHDDVR